MHLAGALLDPRAKELARIPAYIKKKAVRIVERIGEQLIAEKLEKEFRGEEDEDETGDVNMDEQTAEGPGNDAAAAPGAKGSPKKSILAEAWTLSEDEFEYVRLRECLFVVLALPSPLPFAPRSSPSKQVLVLLKFRPNRQPQPPALTYVVLSLPYFLLHRVPGRTPASTMTAGNTAIPDRSRRRLTPGGRRSTRLSSDQRCSSTVV